MSRNEEFCASGRNFLNPTRDYVHHNQNVPNFGAYGDIMIRDRKMYVVPTPYAIADGLTGRRTLILPSRWNVPAELQAVGALERQEAQEVAVSYEFDLKHAELRTISEPNPNAGNLHAFTAYRLRNDDQTPVSMTTKAVALVDRCRGCAPHPHTTSRPTSVAARIRATTT